MFISTRHRFYFVNARSVIRGVLGLEIYYLSQFIQSASAFISFKSSCNLPPTSFPSPKPYKVSFPANCV